MSKLSLCDKGWEYHMDNVSNTKQVMPYQDKRHITMKKVVEQFPTTDLPDSPSYGGGSNT